MNVTSLLSRSGRPRWYSLVGVFLAPLLVAGGFLWATWNTDERLRKVEAAVVNLDQAVTLNGQMVPLGRQLAAALVDDKRAQNFSWVLADKAGADAGLKAGRYAAVVTIPENFSAAATSYAKDASAARQATIGVTTSQITGVADVALGQAVAQAAVDTLNQTLTSSYIENVYVGFSDMGKQLTTVADGADSLYDGASQLADGLGQAATGSKQLSDGLATAAKSNPKLLEGGSGLVTGAKQLSGGGTQLSDGMAKYIAGVDKLIAGTLSQLGSIPDLRTLFAGAATYVTGAGAFATAFGTSTTCGAGSTSVVCGVVGLASGISALSTGIASASSQADTLPTCTDLGISGSVCTDYQTKAGTLQGTLTALKTNASTAATGAGQFSYGLTTYVDPSSGMTAVQAAAGLAGAAPTLSGGLTTAKNALPSDAQISVQTDGLNELKGAGTQVKDAVGQLASGAGSLTTGLEQYADGVKQYAAGIAKAAGGASDLAGGLNSLQVGATQLADGSKKLADGLKAGADKVPSYTPVERQQLGKVVAAPISTTGLDNLVRPTVSWASLLLVIGLWLGAMATYLVLQALRPRLLLSSLPTWRLIVGAVLPGLGLVAAQAVALVTIGEAAMRLPLLKAVEIGGVMLLAAVAFTLVNHALVAWLRGAGRLIAVAFATLTTASAITYALPGVFDALRPFSPLSPALDAIRSIATDGSQTTGSVFTLIGWSLLGLLASAIAVARARQLRPEAVVLE